MSAQKTQIPIVAKLTIQMGYTLVIVKFAFLTNTTMTSIGKKGYRYTPNNPFFIYSVSLAKISYHLFINLSRFLFKFVGQRARWKYFYTKKRLAKPIAFIYFCIHSAARRTPSLPVSYVSPPCKYTRKGSRIGASAESSIDAP